jgi:hypothetical protein
MSIFYAFRFYYPYFNANKDVDLTFFFVKFEYLNNKIFLLNVIYL